MRNAIEKTGKLTYLGWQSSWTLAVEHESGPTDIKQAFWNVAEALKGKRVTFTVSTDLCRLAADETSDFALDFDQRGAGILVKREAGGWGFTNVVAYLEAIAMGLNASEVVLSIGDGNQAFQIRASPDQRVPTLEREPGFPNGNSIGIGMEIAKDRCRMGQRSECCLFLTASKDGFLCAKFDAPIARTMLARLGDGQTSAQRIGNCRLKVSRQPEETRR